MLENKKVLAVIQARGGSKGIPKKNIYPLDGHPLIAYTIAAARASKYVDELVVTTDSEEIAEASRAYGASVPFMRPAELAGDTVVSVDSLHHAALESEKHFGGRFDIVIELPCVAPLRTAEDIDGALEKLVTTGANSVISMANTGEKHPVRLKRLVNDQITDFCKEYPEPAKGSRRQDLEPCYIRNGAIYSMTRDTLIDLFSRHGPDSRPYVMPEERSVNVDGWMDLRIVELMIKDGQCGNKPRLVERTSIERFGKVSGPHILVTAPLYFMPAMREAIIAQSNCTLAHGASAAQVAELLQDAAGWLCSPSPTYMIDGKLLEGARKLKIIATPSTGSNHIDAAWCARHGIKLITLRGSPVIDQVKASSEFSFALLLAVMRKLPYAFDAARKGSWREIEARFRGVELSGKTLGIIGYGRIGSNLSRYARAMGMRVIAFDPNVRIADAEVAQAARAEEVLRASDAVAVCVHLDDATRGMVNAQWFGQMKDGAWFINTSRGEVVDEAALLQALESGKLRAAGVDVVSNEQAGNLAAHPVVAYARGHDNLIITPHMAGLTVESEMKTARYAFDAIRRELGLVTEAVQ
jgi:phosphoglycerate dehydrogenase-like enzyme/CMP-N-acetylneuraminic acid synthetase